MQSTNDSTSPVTFRFKNLGPVDEAELELGDLTIIAGRNNTGKTYLVYTLYGFLKMWNEWPGAADYFRKERNTSTQSDTKQPSPIERLIKDVRTEGHARREVDRETLNQERKAVIQELVRDFSEGALSGVFSSPPSAFEGASIEVEISAEFPEERSLEISLRAGEVFSIQYDGTEIVMTCSKVEEDGNVEFWLSDFYLRFLLQELSYDPFILSAERFGISLFYKELDFTKNRLVELLQQMGDDKDRESFSPFLLIDRTTSRYALPIKDNIDYTRGISDLQKGRSDIFDSKLFDDIKDMMGGYYRSAGDAIQFRSKARKQRGFTIPLHIASSSARELSDLYFFLRHVAHENHLLIIDEPESHLDTANQIELARLLARCVRAGLKVLITTHSDYIVKEINNLIMLSRPFENKDQVVRKLKYHKDDFLDPDAVRAYVAEGNSLSSCEIDTFGIDMPSFEATIDAINQVSNELASRLLIENEDE